MFRTKDWKILYDMKKDGCTITAFFSKCKGNDTTIIIIKDTQGNKFGAFCTEEWHKEDLEFYGDGDSFLFSFNKDAQVPIVNRWTGLSYQFQHSNKDYIGIGGGEDGKFGLFLGHNFQQGSSTKCQCYDNENLTGGAKDFEIVQVEVWGIDYYY